VYPAEGTPTISGPTGIFTTAPHPNAARLFQAWLHTRRDPAILHRLHRAIFVHAQVQSKPGTPEDFRYQADEEDAAGVERMTEEIKTRYARLFRV